MLIKKTILGALFIVPVLVTAGCAGAGTDAKVETAETEESASETIQTGESTQEQTTSGSESQGADDEDEEGVVSTPAKSASDRKAPDITGLTHTDDTDIEYSDTFAIYNYDGGYSFIDVFDDTQYLIVPEDGDVPDGLDDNVVVLQKPIDNIYMLATASVNLFDRLDAFGNIKFSGIRDSSLTNENYKARIDAGDITFAGRYSEPDYETLIKGGCDLAIESTRIYHSPDTKEMLESLDIPVFVDRSSYESHPLGRTEWIKVYGVLTGKTKEAQDFFTSQVERLGAIRNVEKTDKTVAFFYVSTDGHIVVRRSEDYVPKMIDMAGGKYVPSDMSDLEKGLSTVSISVERFYADCKDADYLVYNASVNTPIKSISDLIGLDATFEDFKAVKEGNVWTTDASLYAATDSSAEIVEDLNNMITGGDAGKMTFLKKVE